MIEVFAAGAEGRASYRIPAILVAADGSLLAFAEGRWHSTADHGDIDVVLRRCADGGHTWSPIKVLCAGQGATWGNPGPVLDRRSGAILLLTTRGGGDVDEEQIGRARLTPPTVRGCSPNAARTTDAAGPDQGRSPRR